MQNTLDNNRLGAKLQLWWLFCVCSLVQPVLWGKGYTKGATMTKDELTVLGAVLLCVLVAVGFPLAITFSPYYYPPTVVTETTVVQVQSDGSVFHKGDDGTLYGFKSESASRSLRPGDRLLYKRWQGWLGTTDYQWERR